ncbi:VOC family protein [Dyadobacter sp. CY261]|uniref:VOC family protein n=1 Tax=Dyadobacter sp. CY261 TaxID=2907203 RepID=UPI001F2CCE98|nr:VOC family protein [Dyadobacter sp. CY261]MCF0074945.1 VOC family protein [Dyadobacter sp. CY261]
MTFISARIITANIDHLIDFYEQVTGFPANRYTEDFAEFRTPVAVLAIGSTRTLQLFGGESIASPAANRSVILEFRVDDVDAHYERLADYLGKALVQKPTTMPWGNRSLLFRDPDGNLINFFTPGGN